MFKVLAICLLEIGVSLWTLNAADGVHATPHPFNVPVHHQPEFLTLSSTLLGSIFNNSKPPFPSNVAGAFEPRVESELRQFTRRMCSP
jgi:hypothetical protein